MLVAMAQLDYRARTSMAATCSQGQILNPAREVSHRTAKEVNMAAMTMVLRKLRVMPRNASGNARVRIHHPTLSEQPVPAAKLGQWNDLIPGSEVSRLRYIAELDGLSAPLARIVLP